MIGHFKRHSCSTKHEFAKAGKHLTFRHFVDGVAGVVGVIIYVALTLFVIGAALIAKLHFKH